MVILDIALPKTDGFKVARAMKTDNNLKRVPLIAMSGYSESDAKRLAGSMTDFDHYLLKPANPLELLALLAAICATNDQ